LRVVEIGINPTYFKGRSATTTPMPPLAGAGVDDQLQPRCRSDVRATAEGNDSSWPHGARRQPAQVDPEATFNLCFLRLE
jgi:hypothetical protein